MAGATTGAPDIGVGAEDTVARAKVAHEVAAPTGPLSFSAGLNTSRPLLPLAGSALDA
jgi:hypothetical protein